ncbi:MAG TPA: cyclophilin-like fold protein, partial [Nitrososphaeraceae archaeon]|nr:cyclophilin-like fold protein [Nitrososphaeraceae archaeon]
SRIPINILIDKKETLKGELIRHLSPLTVSHILKQLPLFGSIHYNSDNFCYIQTQLNIGTEKQKKIYSQGDITLMTSTGFICFILKEIITSFPMNHIGKISSANMDLLRDLKPTDTLKIILV